MSTPLAVAQPQIGMIRPSLRMITVTAFLINALLWLFDVFSNGPDSLNMSHVAIPLVVAGIVAWRKRWTPAIGALVGGLLIVEGYVFIRDMLIQPASAADFADAAIFFGSATIGLVAGIGATVQNYGAPRSRPFVDQRAPAWTYPALLAFVALVLGGIVTTAVQPRAALPGVSAETLATLPALGAKDYLFQKSELRARAGETVVLRLDNADTSTHYLDIDEFNVHALMPAGKSNVAIFTPTEPGTYTFYCRPHADKAAKTGMVGTLVVAP
jgi:plastocyanin